MKLDPRTKLIILIIANFLLLFHLNTISTTLFILLLIVLFFLQGRVATGFKLALVYFIAHTFSLIETTNKIMILITYLAFSLKIMLPCIYSGILLCTTTTPTQAVATLRKSKISEKIIIPLCVLIRFFPTLKQEVKYIHHAMKLRGLLNPLVICKNPILTFEYYVIPILMSTSTLAQDLTIAAICKGIENKNQHSCIQKIQFTYFDFLIIFIFFIIIGYGFV